MIVPVQSIVIAWQRELLGIPQPSDEEVDAAASGHGVQQAELTGSASTIDPFPWDGGMPQQCYDNVTHLVELLGGEMVCGWALADAGPLSARRQSLPPLYGRWISHVVWRDGGGKLWEVTPRFEVGNLDRVAWGATQFAPDREALFVTHAEGHWSQPSRYVALRPEGERVADLLQRAETSNDEERRLRLLKLALAELAAHGFTPKECRVETSGTRTNNIWLIAE